MDSVTRLSSEYAVAIKVRCGTALFAARAALQVMTEAGGAEDMLADLRDVITGLENIETECERVIVGRIVNA